MIAPGGRLGGYLVIERLGPRGSSDLWVGREASGDPVILDIVPVRVNEKVAREIVEAQLPLARSLLHPHVLPLLDGGVESGQRYWVWPYLDGLFLDRVLESAKTRERWPAPGVSARIARSIAAALDYIHRLERPVLARYLSPTNVLITRDGRVLVTELGTADSSENAIETAGRSQSTPYAYLSPELASNEEIDPKSDLFALGAIFWEMLAARPLFLRETDLETLEAVRQAHVGPLPAGCPASLSEIASTLLARPRQARFDDAASVIEALDRAMNELPDTSVDAMIQILEALSPPENPAHRTVKSDPPGHAVPGDDFFDAMRDGGGVENQRFQILGRLGSGGMGHVFRVRDRELDEVVALKIIPKGSSIEMQSIERLRREVRLARRIASDHICRIYDIVDLGDGTRGMMMELIEGTTLAEMLKAKVKVDYEKFARWACQLCDGLGAAHALSIIHRDLKPENVMIRHDGSAVILDFGIARADSPEKDQKLTRAGIILGTPLYMSPEQLSNRPLDGRSDLYALGLILAELITGKVPRAGASYAEILAARVVTNLEYSIRDVDPNVPPALAAIIDSLLHPSASDRPATASRVGEQLRSFLGESPTGESRAPGLESEQSREIAAPLVPLLPETRGWWTAIGLLALVLGALLFFWIQKEGAATIDVPEGPPDVGHPAEGRPARMTERPGNRTSQGGGARERDAGNMEPAPPPPRPQRPEDPEPM